MICSVILQSTHFRGLWTPLVKKLVPNSGVNFFLNIVKMYREKFYTKLNFYNEGYGCNRFCDNMIRFLLLGILIVERVYFPG